MNRIRTATVAALLASFVGLPSAPLTAGRGYKTGGSRGTAGSP